MGRKKIEIEKIETVIARRVTFSKRRAGLLKKAEDVAAAVNADIAIIVFSQTGKLYKFSTTSMEEILSRYTNNFDLNLPYIPSPDDDIPSPPSPDNPMDEVTSSTLNALREELATLRTSCMRMTGDELQGLSYDELQQVERQIAHGMHLVKQKIQEQLLAALDYCRFREHMAKVENEVLRRRVEELKRGILVSAPPCTTYRPIDPGSSDPNPDVTEKGKQKEEQIVSLHSWMPADATTIEVTTSSESESR